MMTATKRLGARIAAIMAAAALALAASLAFAQPAQAATSYQIWVSGTLVTSDNASDVFGDGTVSYDAATNILTLNNATLTYGTSDSPAACAIRTNQGLTLALEGDNVILAKLNNGITPIFATAFECSSYSESATIKGPGKLTIESLSADAGAHNQYGLYCMNALSITGGAEISIEMTTSTIGHLPVSCGGNS